MEFCLKTFETCLLLYISVLKYTKLFCSNINNYKIQVPGGQRWSRGGGAKKIPGWSCSPAPNFPRLGSQTIKSQIKTIKSHIEESNTGMI